MEKITIPEDKRYPIPPFTLETALQKVQLAENAWNSKDPEKVALAYTIDTEWRNRTDLINGREAVKVFLKAKWEKELFYKLKKELWGFRENRMAVRFEYEYQNAEGQWFRAYGNENWEFDKNGLMAKRFASINDLPIKEKKGNTGNSLTKWDKKTMFNQSSFTLLNKQNGQAAFRLFSFDDNGLFDQIQRHNFFTLIWIKQGSGKVNTDFDFKENTLITFAPYQPYIFSEEKPVKGTAIFFHPDFFCIYKHQKELELNGVLYNNVYQPPFVQLDAPSARTLEGAWEQIRNEMQNPALAQHELLVSYLKIILITASRLKLEQQPQSAEMLKDKKEPFILQKLKDAIEEHFKTKHSASDYADLLYITPKALAKITKTHFNKTLSSLINERIIIEAKRELYLTDKTVKEIAYELGYEDEYYFSRFFKTNAEVSPQLYRDTVGFAKGVIKY